MSNNYYRNSPSPSERLKKDLYEHIRKEDWNQVVEVHRRDQSAFTTVISDYRGETALMLAILEGKAETVKSLVGLIKSKEILRKLKNKKGRTCLHHAATTGKEEMCKIIAGVDRSLVLARDYKGETPLFRAVRYGWKEAFLYLHSLAVEHRDPMRFESIRYCWNDVDQTILHNAIIRENFDLAFQIIHMYKELVNVIDKEGDSPLHALARKPAAFKSGSSLRGIWNEIIYEMRKLKIEEPENLDPEGLKGKKNQRSNHEKKECKNFDIESRGGHTDQKGSNTSQEPRSCSPKSWFVKLASKAIPVVFIGDMTMIKKIMVEKEKHVWAGQILDELLKDATDLCDGRKALTASEREHMEDRFLNSDFLGDDSRDQDSKDSEDDISKSGSNKQIGSASTNSSESQKKEESHGKKLKKDSAILVAAKYGIKEIIKKILEHFPLTIFNKNKESKNVVLIALENRHVEILKFLLNKYKGEDHIAFQKVDEDGNTALHYAAMYDVKRVRPWPVPGAAMQMEWEIKWYEYVENAMPSRLYLRTNKEGHTSKEKFSDDHKGLVMSGGEWLTNTATSCSVVASLIAGVAFASSTSTPGDTSVKKDFAFELFAISSLLSLAFSVTSLIMFLAILTSRHQEKDFGKELPRKILLGLTSLFIAIASVLVTFCSGHFITFKDNFKYAVFPVYAVTLLPLCLFAAAQFALYFDLIMATFSNPFKTDSCYK